MEEQGLVTLQIEDLFLTVDEETANQLTSDAEYAALYADQIRKKLNKNSVSNSCGNTKTINKVWVAKIQTETDKAATRALLHLRKTMNKVFNDKKNCKNTLWLQIATKLNNMGFYVGEGTEGREKCRQKFANLQNAFLKYEDKKRQTGEGKVDPPPFYTELGEILGDKHKCIPTLLVDSLNTPSCSSSDSSKQTEETRLDEAENIRSTSQNRYKKNNNRPAKTELLEKFLELEEKKREDRKQEFAFLTNFLNKESENRHQQIMALIKSTKNKKRRRESSDSDG